MKTEIEIWKSVVKYPYYEASNIGNIRSLDKVVKSRFGNAIKKGKVLSKCINGGYFKVGIMNNGRVMFKKVSVLVALAWHPNPENKKCVNHKDTNKLNDCEWNLEWNTHSENSIHARENNCWHGYKHSLSTVEKIVAKNKQMVIATKVGGKSIFFDSLKECAESLGYNSSTITLAIKKGTTTRNGYKINKFLEPQNQPT